MQRRRSSWDRFYQKYPASLTDNQEWMQGYTDGAIYTHAHTLQYNADFIAACDDKKTGLLNLSYIQFGFPAHYFDGYPVSA